MKKQILIIVSVVVIICSFVACTHNSGSESISTTAVTDSNGITHYYEPVTDENNKIVTDKNNDVVTTEITTTGKTTQTQTSSTSAQNEADNVVDYEPKKNDTTTATTKLETIITKTTQTNTITTQNQNQSVTDKDGWIDKWY